MPSTLIKLFSLLAFDMLAMARPQSNAPADTSTYSGNYRIVSCGTQVPAVKSLLDSAYQWIQTDRLSMKSPAYDAFFGNVKRDYVANLFECITSGLDVSGHPPTLVCVNEAYALADANIHGFWEACQSNPAVNAISPLESTEIYLCPRFFDLHVEPQPRGCGTVNHANTRLIQTAGTHGWMLSTQYGVLIEALANVYIPKATTRPPLLYNVIDVNQCLELRPDVAMLNPSNYAYLATSKLTLDACELPSMKRSANGLNHQDIRAGCTHYPTRQPDRELIEVNGDSLNGSNGTKLVALGCSGSEANSSSCFGKV